MTNVNVATTSRYYVDARPPKPRAKASWRRRMFQEDLEEAAEMLAER